MINHTRSVKIEDYENLSAPKPSKKFLKRRNLCGICTWSMSIPPTTEGVWRSCWAR